jgi:hypothetical protein
MTTVEVRSSGWGPRARCATSIGEETGRLGVLGLVIGLRLLVVKDWPRDGVTIIIQRES